MSMDTRPFAHILEVLYGDSVEVYSLVSETAIDGTTNNKYSDVVTSSDKCRLSYRKIDVPYEADARGEPITFETKLICKPTLVVKAGDYLKVSRYNGATFEDLIQGYAGHPAHYGTHQEVILIHKGRV